MTSAEFRKLQGLPPPGYDHSPRPRVQDAKPAQQAPTLDKDREGETCRTGRPRVRFVLCRVRLLDADAKHGSCKDIIDGLTKAGLIQGDREDQICLEVEQVKVGHYHEERVEIEITYPDTP